MTIAIPAQPVQTLTAPIYRNPINWITAPLQRLWWHTYAYLTIFGLMLLTLASLVVLYIYDQSRKVFSHQHDLDSSPDELSTSVKYRS